MSYAECPRCGARGELEGSADLVDATPGEAPVHLRERMDCPGCGLTWWERFDYVGRAVDGAAHD